MNATHARDAVAQSARTGSLRSYGLLWVLASAFLVVAVSVQPLPRDRTELTEADAAGAAAPPGSIVEAPPGATPAPAAGGSGGAAAPGALPGSSGLYLAPGAQLCADRVEMVPGDPYSPTCYSFAGDNGGATSRGVTATDIVLTVRQAQGLTISQGLSAVSGENVTDPPERVVDTIRAYAEYFNEHFQLYGRRLRVEVFNGQGSLVTESTGGGQEQARADAITASNEIGAFADVSFGPSTVYANALAQQQVISTFAPSPSRGWFAERRPYAWSIYTDHTTAAAALADFVVARLAGGTADYAGTGIQGQPRVFGFTGPENAEYREAFDELRARLSAAGVPVAAFLTYRLDLNTVPNQASNIIAQLKDAGVTTILCMCDPAVLAIGLTPKASEQSYQPEWVTPGIVYVDQDSIAQIFDQDQWSHALGSSFSGAVQPGGDPYAYAAYKSRRPNGEPPNFYESLYYQMYIVALGAQLAGPDLTPETFAQGLAAYPGGTGPVGTWHFGADNFTPTRDYREVWWDADRTSPENGEPGSYVELNGGARYLPGHPPTTPAPFFQG